MPAVDDGGGYGAPAGYGVPAGYGAPGGYGGPASSGTPAGYGAPAGGDGSGYGAAGHGSLRGDYPDQAPNQHNPQNFTQQGFTPQNFTPQGQGSQGQNPQARQGLAPPGIPPQGRSGMPGAPMNQGTAPPVRNPNGGIQAAPGSPMARANLGGPGYGQGGQPGGLGAPQPDRTGAGIQPGHPGHGWGPMTYRTIRTGGWVVFGLIVLAIVMMPLSPLVVTLLAFLWSILARTGTRLDRKAQRNRFERGTEGGGFLRSLASAPGAVLASVLTSVASFILPAIAGIAVLVLTRLDIAGIVPGGYSEEWSVWAAGAAGALVLWVGPGAASLRYGSRLVVSGATHNQLGRLVTLSAIALLIIIAFMVIQSGAGMAWWPLTENPFSYLPGPV